METVPIQNATRFGQQPVADQPAIGSIASFADIFCGIGGFHYAASSLGLRCVFACDIDQDASNQYERNFGIRPAGDITAIPAADLPDHDILFAGFPCQPFSVIGNHKGLTDARGTLVFEILRILARKRPMAFVLENVKQFSTICGGTAIERVVGELKDLEYRVDWRILNALDYGLPQKRERCIIVGFLGNMMDCYSWPSPIRIRKPLAKILETNPAERHHASERIRSSRQEKHSATTRPTIWHENKGGNVSSHPYSCALRAGASHNYLLVDGERRLTPREQLRLQGFPESFEVIGSDSQIRKQTGNAVPVPMVRAVIKEIIHASNR